LLRQSSDARIINISSVASEIALPFQAFYSMTKASIDAFTKALYIEVKPFSIQVGSILPGDIQTDFTKNRLQPAKANDELYGERMQASIRRMEKDEANGMSPRKIAKKVRKMIEKKRMPVRTSVGLSYKTIRLLYRLLPEKWVLFFVRKLYG
jgi:short-subunit dehydrogenase